LHARVAIAAMDTLRYVRAGGIALLQRVDLAPAARFVPAGAAVARVALSRAVVRHPRVDLYRTVPGGRSHAFRYIRRRARHKRDTSLGPDTATADSRPWCFGADHLLEGNDTMNQIDKVLYTGKTRTTGGRDGASRSSDGRLEIKLSSPGSSGAGTNPEQLFAAGWSACFIGAMGLAAAKMKVTLPADLAVDAEVDLGSTSGAYFLQARLNVSLPGVEAGIAQALVDSAHQSCPYSKATRGNIGVEIKLV
jgi:osmotically inducible protein OsmC